MRLARQFAKQILAEGLPLAGSGNIAYPFGVSAHIKRKKKSDAKYVALFLVEVTGLEPTTSWSRTKRATKLRYTSINSLVIIQQIAIKIN